MSKEAVAAFLEEIPRDPDLQKELVALAARHGHDFTADELNEADLEAIAGGVGADIIDIDSTIAGGLDPGDIIDIPTVAKKKPAKK